MLSAATAQVPKGADMTLKSPDGRIVFLLTAGDQMKYSVVWNGKPIIKDATLGISVDGDDLGVKAQADRFPQLQLLDDKFPMRGVHPIGATRCQSGVIAVTSGAHAKTWNLEVRVFNDAVAYRYNVPESGKHRIDGESTAWNLPAGSELWYLRGKNRSYEDKYKMGRVGEFEPGTEIMTLATAVLPGGGYAMLSEANVFNYSDMALLSGPDNTFKAFFHNDQQGWIAGKRRAGGVPLAGHPAGGGPQRAGQPGRAPQSVPAAVGRFLARRVHPAGTLDLALADRRRAETRRAAHLGRWHQADGVRVLPRR